MSKKRMMFTAEMVQAFLANRKTQTRRIWPIQPGSGNDSYVKFDPKTGVASWPGESEFDNYSVKSRYQVGDLVWISESTWESPKGFIAYRASIPERPAPDWKLRTGRFMFKRDARLWREVTQVRAQRLQEISEPEVMFEAPPAFWTNSGGPMQAFIDLWDSINGKTHPWANNDWVFAYTLKEVEAPEQ